MNTISQRQIEDLAQRYGLSSEAVMVLSRAIEAGHGGMAQFSHPELGGPGQWSHSGMTMIGDMFNDELKNKVKQLCAELAGLLSQEASASQPETSSWPTQDAWWPADLGSASSTGSQNHIRYAYFPDTHRLAIKIGVEVTIYDTADHAIFGVAQQQSSDSSLIFTSQHGLLRQADLHVVSRTS